MTFLPIRLAGAPRTTQDPVDAETLTAVLDIVRDVRESGEAAVRAHGERLGDLEAGAPMLLDPEALAEARTRIDAESRGVLERTAQRIRRFAEAQRAGATGITTSVPGGSAGERLVPVDVAGCYAPGGRYPLPSSVLMTAVTARAAGVGQVWVASPRPTDITLAAAAISGADGLLAVGGAQAIAALAFGIPGVPSADVVVGPGNRWVTAAKYAVSATVGVDLIAGPSELVVVATPTSDPVLVAADLLAQAEHDPDAVPVLVVLAPESAGSLVVQGIREELERQLADLPTAPTARLSLAQSWAVVSPDADVIVAEVDRFAPEHLQLHAGAEHLAPRLSRFGGLFVGADTAEVFGDYGAGPNHTLPTGGTARYSGGLSVHTFLRRPTWMELESETDGWEDIARDAMALARMEGLEAHARAAERRLEKRPATER